MGLRHSVYFGMMVVLMLCYGARGADDNSDSCASALTPCALYLNSTNPPKSCCDPLLTVIQTQQKCLCNLLSSVPSLGINLTQALELPARCGKNVTTASCKSASGGTDNTSPPAGRPSSSSSSSSNNDNSKNTSEAVPKYQFSEIVALMSLLVLGMLHLQP